MDEWYEVTQFFNYNHLPAHLQEISKPFADLAQHLLETLPPSQQKENALHRLLEAKDCAVRATLIK